MIFRTINADAKKLTEQFGLLNKSFRDIKKDFANGLGFKNSLFQTSISKTDYQALQKFNSAIKVTNDGLTKSQRITKAWNENMTGCSIAAKRMGNDLVTGKKNIQDISKAMNTASVSTKAFGVAMNVMANVGFMLAITAITKVISELAQAQDNAAQAAKEATETYKSELDSIADYKQKLSELHEELKSGNLSYEETKTKRTELMTIQDELIEKFGTEEDAIKSVTDAVKGQIDALDDLNEKAYRDWVAKADHESIWTQLLPWGKSGLDQAIDYMESEKTVSFYDMQNANLSDELQAIQKEIDETIRAKYNLDKTFAMFNVTGTPDELRTQLENIRQDYIDISEKVFKSHDINDHDLWEEYRKETTDSINEAILSLDKGLEKHQDTYRTYIEGLIKYDSEYSDEYANILQKRAELESAQNSGNKDEVKRAKQEFMDSINDAIIASDSDESIKKYFKSLYPELQAEFDNWTFEFNLEANKDGINDLAKEIGEKYTATDLLGMVDDESAVIADNAFNSLIDKAIEYGVCTDKSAEEVQKLIDLLVELGIVQDNVKGDTFNDKNPISSTTDILSQVELLSKGLDQLDKIYADVKDKEDFDWSSILNNKDFQETFGEMGDAYDDFIKIISNSPTDIKACQTAFDNLATSYIYNSGVLDNLTEETKAATIAMLEQMGVANADIIVTAQLAAKKIEAEVAANGLTDATYNSISALVQEGKVAGVTATSLFNLITKMKIFNASELSVVDKIKSIENLAKAFGIATDSANNYWSMERQLAYAKSKGISDEQFLKNTSDHYLKQIEAKFEPIKVEYSGGSATRNVSKKSGSGSSAKKTKQAFDWTANSITNLQNKLDSLNTQLENTSGWEKQLAIQKKIIESQQQLMKGYASQANAYKKYYNEVSKGLTDDQKKMIESGTTFKVTTYGQKTYEKLSKAQSAYQDWQEALKNVDSTLIDIAETADAIYNIPLEKASEKVEIFTKRIESLEKNFANISTLDDIRNVYNKQRQNYTKIYQEQLEAETSAKKSLTKESKEMKKAIDGEKASIQKYIKEQISNGKAIDTNKLKTTKAQLAAVEYNSALEASRNATENVKTALEDYTSALQELAKAEIDRVIDYYDNRSDLNSSKQDRFKLQMEIAEAQGYTASDEYYQKLIALTDSELERLEKEKVKITDRMNNGNLSEDGYYDALQHLYDISDEIDNCKKNQIEWNKAIQQIKWDKFDTLLNKLNSINKESNFMISLYNEDDFYDENGNITDDGMTVQALHAQNYNTYLAQSEKYAEEIKKINAELAKDPNNQILIERRNELIEGQQDAILNAQSEKEAIIDLIHNGYTAQIEAMSDLIDKKQELLDKEKALHDYQKSIREQSNDITLLKKQIAALEGTTGRAEQAKLRKLKEQLEKAEKQLAEDQYQHSIDTQKDALDNALDEYREKTEDYLKDSEKLFEDALDDINSYSTTILDNLQNKAESVGYELSESIITVWSNTAPISTFKNAVIESFTGIGTAIDDVISKLEQMYSYYEDLAKISVDSTTNDYLDFPDKDTATKSTVDTAKIKDLLGKASGKNGASDERNSTLNAYLSSLGYAKMSKKDMVKLAQALGLSEINSVKKLEELGTTKDIKDALENYLNSGSASVDTLGKTGGVSASNIKKIISLIQNADEYSKDRKNLSDLNKYIYDNYNKKWLSQSQMVPLANYLGFSDVKDTKDITSSLKSKMLTKLKKAGFHDGGLIKSVGEDGIALVRNEEAILTKEQVKVLRDNLIPMNTIIQDLQLNRMKNTPIPTNIQRGTGDTYITVQGNLDNVTMSDLKQAMIDTKNATLKATPDYMWSEMGKFGSR